MSDTNQYDDLATWSDYEGGMAELLRHGVKDSDIPDGLKTDWARMESSFMSFEADRKIVEDKIREAMTGDWF